MAHFDYLFKGGTLVIPFAGLRRADLGVGGEKIQKIAEDLAADARVVIDARGKYIFPGAIDAHTHVGASLPFWEDFQETSTAAARGGVTTLFTLLKVDFFNEKETSYLRVLPGVLEKTAGKAAVDFSFHLQIPSRLQIQEIPQYYSRLGIQSFKTYMAYKERKIAPGVDDGTFYCLLKAIGDAADGALPMLHAESDEIIKITTEAAKKQNLTGLKAWNSARPCFSEVHALIRGCYLAQVTGAPLYIVHVSCKESVVYIEKEKSLGRRIIAETCPQYLVLSDELKGDLAKINPPIRSREDREALWEGVRQGTIDCLGTDHGSKKREMKGGNIWEAALGFPGIGTLFPLIYTEGSRRGIPLPRIAELCSGNTARIFGLFPRKGSLQAGADADLIVVDPAVEQAVRVQELYEHSDFSPYAGMLLRGWPEMTMLRGAVIYEKGKILERGRGIFLPRFPAQQKTIQGERT